MVRDSVNLIANAHVVNLSTEKGTFTNDYGQFRIVVSIGDSISVSSVQHQTYKTVITEQIAFSEKLNVILDKRRIELDEIVLKKHDLIGILESDRKKVPKDSIAAVGRSISEIIEELAQKERQGRIDTEKPSTNGTADIAQKNTDPTKSFNGVGGTVGLGIGTGKKKEKEIKEIVSDQFTSKVVYDKFEKDYFLLLKIPEDQIFNFIDYCKQFKIKDLYNQGRLLDIAVISSILRVLSKMSTL